MPRKRKPAKDTPEYWSKLLTRHGLSMERGRSRRLIYVGDSGVVEVLDGVEHSAEKGKNKAFNPEE
jgi:hypothetical protein